MSDQEIIKWIAFAKGDLPGHPFHGNQYTEGGGIHEASFPTGLAHKLLDEHEYTQQMLADTKAQMGKHPLDREYSGTVGDSDQVWDAGRGMAQAHLNLRNFHRAEAIKARDAGDTRMEDAHSEARNLHAKAYEAALRYSRRADEDGDNLERDNVVQSKIARTEKLLDLSKKAYEATRRATGE